MSTALILAVLQSAAVLLPILAQAIPIIEKALSGGEVTEADLATLDSVAQALNQAVQAKVAAT